MKAMRGRIALPMHFVRNYEDGYSVFAQAFGVRTRPRVALCSTCAIIMAPSLQ
jgi:hypothetical protein